MLAQRALEAQCEPPCPQGPILLRAKLGPDGLVQK